MEIQTIQLRKLTPTAGKMLTNGEVCSAEVYLGCNDSPENWWEVTEEEAVKIEQERLAALGITQEG